MITLVKTLRSVRNKILKCRLCFRTFYSSNYIFTTLLFMFATLWTTTRNVTFARIRRPHSPYYGIVPQNRQARHTEITKIYLEEKKSDKPIFKQQTYQLISVLFQKQIFLRFCCRFSVPSFVFLARKRRFLRGKEN